MRFAYRDAAKNLGADLFFLPRLLLPVIVLLFCLTCFAVPCLSEVSNLPVYDLSQDFSAVHNPNGVWSFGQTYSLGGAFQTFSRTGSGVLLDAWSGYPNGPAVEHNGTSGTLTYGSQTWTPGTVSLHAGQRGEYAVVRFTSPTTRFYSLITRFYAGDIHASTDVHVLLNGSPIFSAEFNGVKPTDYNPLITLKAGDTLDFVVGYGADHLYSNDDAGLSVRLGIPGELGGLPKTAGLGLYACSNGGGGSAIRGVLHYDGASGNFLEQLDPSLEPQALTFGPDGGLYAVASVTSGLSIVRYDPMTQLISPFVPASVPGGYNKFRNVFDLAFGPDGNLYVLNYDPNNQTVLLCFDGKTGAFLRTVAAPSADGFNFALKFAFGPDHALYILNYDSHNYGNIKRYDVNTGHPTGTFVAPGTGGMGYPQSFTFGPDGNLYVSNRNASSLNANILRFNGATGAFIDTFVDHAVGSANDNVDDVFGPDGDLYVASNAGAIYRYNGITGAAKGIFVPYGNSGLGQLYHFVFGPVPPGSPAPKELLTNGGFETGDLNGWTRTDKTSIGTYQVFDTMTLPFLGIFDPPTVGPKTGKYYAAAAETGPSASALSQTFTVPQSPQSVVLSFDMFVNNAFSGGAVFGSQGLDYLGENNQQARVDLLSANASPFDTSVFAVLKNFYDGADAYTGNPNGYTHYEFDITSFVSNGGTYALRFAQAGNRLFLNQGIDNVSVQFTPRSMPAPPTLAGIVPNSAAAGGSGFSLTVYGAGFSPSSVALWNGQPRPTHFVSASQITVDILASDIVAPGGAKLTVANDGSVSAAKILVIGQAKVVLTALLSRDSATQDIIATVTASNTGTAPAVDFRLGGAALSGISAASGLPASFGTIPSQGSTKLSLRFPGLVGPTGKTVALRFTLPGGTSAGSLFVKLP